MNYEDIDYNQFEFEFTFDLRTHLEYEFFYRQVIRYLRFYRNKGKISFQYLVNDNEVDLKLITVHTTSIKLKEVLKRISHLPEFHQFWVEDFPREEGWKEINESMFH